MVKKYGIERIGTYSNFNKYIKRNKLKPKKNESGNPRYEKNPGEQAQIDWKEDISISNVFGEICSAGNNVGSTNPPTYIGLKLFAVTDNRVACFLDNR